MLRPALPFALVLSILLAAAVLLVPRPAARLEGELSDLPPEVALVRLREARAAGEVPFTAALDLMQARLERAARNWDDAMRHYHAALNRPDVPAAEVLDQLADTSLLLGDAEAATAYLRRAHGADPTPERRIRLGRRLRATGDVAAERALLSGVPVERLLPAERSRLTALLFVSGDAAPYAAHLARAAALEGDDAIGARADLLAHHAAIGRGGEAVALFRTWPGEDTAPGLARALVAMGRPEIAAEIATDVVTRRPDLGAALAGAFATPRLTGAGLRPVSAWLSATDRLSPADWSALVAFALSGGELTGLHRAIRSFPGPPPEAFLTVLRYEGAEGLAAHRGTIPPEHLARMPLLSAGLAAASGNDRRLTSALIAAADPKLGEWDRRVWDGLARHLSGTPWQAELLRGDLPPAFARRAADMARQGERAPIATEPGDTDG